MTNIVLIKQNQFLIVGVADTQEDNHHGIAQRWDLFESNQTLTPRKQIGKLIKYTDDTFAVFSGKNNLNKELILKTEIQFFN